MQLIFLGTGSAFTINANNYQSNVLLDNLAGKRLLIDCGTDIRFSLNEQGYTYKDIDAIFISHLHADHVGGLEWLAFSTYFDPSCEKPTLYIHETLVHDLWNKVLSGGLSSLQNRITNLSTFFKVIVISRNGCFTWSDVEFQLVQTIHSMNGFVLMPSFGLLFKINQKQIFLTTDTQLVFNQMKNFYEQADIIFHDCETADYKTGVHAHYAELCLLPVPIKNKMWLYGYQPGVLPDAVAEGFQGFVQKGQTFNWE
ncbi:MAG: Ribonuclease BN [Legionellaceae bacterium]